MLPKRILQISALSGLMLLAACGGEEGEDVIVETDTMAVANDSTNYKIEKAKNIFYAIPSPFETALLLKRAGAEYNADHLNPIQNADNYTSNKAKAINLGIYSADLSYNSIHDQTQESMFYMAAAKKLADGLGVAAAFDNNTMERVESNIENRDSLMGIIAESYWTLDAYLKENDRQHLSALIFAGGWIEGLYLATRVVDGENPNEAITQRIAEQKSSLGNLIALVESYGPHEMLDETRTDLDALQALYADVNVTTKKAESSTDAESGITTIGGETTVEISNEQLMAIANKVAEIRDKYIQ